MFEPGKLQHLLEEPLAAGARKEVPAPFSLQSLIAWLETKDATGEYDYFCHGFCLIGQYLREVCRLPSPRVAGTYYRGARGEREIDLPPHWAAIAVRHPRDFGSALLRARSYQASEACGSTILLAEGV